MAYSTNYCNNLYDNFLQSVNDAESRDKAMISAALTFLYKKGYITKEELISRRSERLYDIRIVCSGTVGLFFDDWSIEVNVNNDLKVLNFTVSIKD